MKQHLLFVLSLFFAANGLFSQADTSLGNAQNIYYTHSVVIYHAPFHYFFDNEPPFYVEPHESNYIKQKSYKRLFPATIGIRYQRRINRYSTIVGEYEVYSRWYYLNESDENINPRADKRDFQTMGFDYIRYVPIHKHIDFVCGTGLRYRYGKEKIIIGYYLYGFEQLPYESRKHDLGFNHLVGIDYCPNPCFSLQLRLSLLGYFYIYDHDYVKYFGRQGNNFPNRADASFSIGTSINFNGKTRK